MNLTNSATPAASSSACCSPVCTSAVSGRCGAIALTSACSGTPSAAWTAITSKPSLPSMRLGGLDVPDRERGAADRVDAADLGDARQRERARRPVGADADGVADREVVAGRSRLVDHDLVRPRRPRALDELERAEPLVGRVEAETERRIVARDRLALLVQDLGLVGVASEVEDRAGGIAHLGQRLHVGEHVLGDDRAAALRPVEQLAAADDGVGLVVGRREDVRERPLDGVGQHEAAADHRDAEHDRDRRQARPHLAAEQALQCNEGHRPTALRTSRISACDERPSSLTISPSARKSTRSAIVAAFGSCVTITVVCPYGVDGAADEAEDLGRGLGVEVARRLVGEEHRRARHERAGDGDALLLAARELGGPVRAAVLEAGRRQELLEPLALGPRACDRERQGDVLLRRQHREQVEELEDEADVATPELREVVVLERRDVDAVDLDRAARRLVETGEDVHERRLARPGRAHDRCQVAAGDVERDAAKRVDGGFPGSVPTRQLVGRDDRARREW